MQRRASGNCKSGHSGADGPRDGRARIFCTSGLRAQTECGVIGNGDGVILILEGENGETADPPGRWPWSLRDIAENGGLEEIAVRQTFLRQLAARDEFAAFFQALLAIVSELVELLLGRWERPVPYPSCAGLGCRVRFPKLSSSGSGWIAPPEAMNRQCRWRISRMTGWAPYRDGPLRRRCWRFSAQFQGDAGSAALFHPLASDKPVKAHL